MDNTYAVIMAGGRGERFWPLSTSKRPKQVLTLVGDKPMMAIAVERLEGLIPPERVIVVTNGDLVAFINVGIDETHVFEPDFAIWFAGIGQRVRALNFR